MSFMETIKGKPIKKSDKGSKEDNRIPPVGHQRTFDSQEAKICPSILIEYYFRSFPPNRDILQTHSDKLVQLDSNPSKRGKLLANFGNELKPMHTKILNWILTEIFIPNVGLDWYISFISILHLRNFMGLMFFVLKWYKFLDKIKIPLTTLAVTTTTNYY